MSEPVNTKKITIALDAMGGDFAPKNEIEGAILAYKEKPAGSDFEIIFVGDENKINPELAGKVTYGLKYTIVHTSEVITMSDDPVAALKSKRGSSLYVAAEIHAKGQADAFVSAGNTGAMLSISTTLLGRIKGVTRPTIGTFMPTVNDTPVFLLDVGATVDMKARFLYEFAEMGNIYAKQFIGIENPRIGLLNIGEEPTKGTDVLKETYTLLQKADLNFIGNIEGRDILMGAADVVVCDGFTGNVVLKFAESFTGILKSKVKNYAYKNMINKLRVALMAPTLRSILSDFDYQNYGGVPLLGVNGVVIIGHGKSSPKAVKNMIIRSQEFIKNDVNSKIEKALEPKNVT